LNIEIEGVILAGGESKRMGTNKSLVNLFNKPLIRHVYDRLIKQVSHISINTNQPIKIFPKKIQFNDHILKKTGPLAGIHAGLFNSKKNWVQFCPNDTPFLPVNLVEKLSFCIKDRGPTIILPCLLDHLEPVFILCHRSLLKNLEDFIDGGGKKMELWIKENNYQIVNFSDPKAFININNHSELVRIETENN